MAVEGGGQEAVGRVEGRWLWRRGGGSGGTDVAMEAGSWWWSGRGDVTVEGGAHQSSRWRWRGVAVEVGWQWRGEVAVEGEGGCRGGRCLWRDGGVGGGG